MVQKRRSLELFEVYARSRRGGQGMSREQEFVKPAPGMRAQATHERSPGAELGFAEHASGTVPKAVPDKRRWPGRTAFTHENGILTIRMRLWTAVAMGACFCLAIVCAYRLGGYFAGGESAPTQQVGALGPTSEPSSGLDRLQVAGTGRTSSTARARAFVTPSTAVVAPKSRRTGRHHLVIAIYPLSDTTTAERALQAFRADGFTEVTLDKAGKYYRLVSPFFESVATQEARRYQQRLLARGKTLNSQYKLGSKKDFSDCYWETVKKE